MVIGYNYIMSSNQPNKPTKPKLSKLQKMRRISGRKRDLLIIIAGIVLGASTQYLSTHVHHLGNKLLGMFIEGVINHNCEAVRLNGEAFCVYFKASLPGMIFEMIVLIIVIVFLVLFFRHDKDDDIIAVLKEIRNDTKDIKQHVGGGNHAEETTITKAQTTETKTKEEGQKSG